MIRYESVSKTFGSGENAVTAVDDVSFEVERGKLVVLLGPSGCGKTTLLRLTNLLLPLTKGDILVDGGSIKDRDPVELRQSMGYAIQEIGLFPNKTIFGNIATVPRLLNWEKERIGDRVDELLEMLQLDPGDFRDRYPAELSGGQQQRIGVARCLAADPDILLMDEPFGAIDPINRVEIQDQFLKVQGELEKTILFVTHDLHEAIKMGDRIAILDKGRLVQYDTPEMLLTSPRDDYIAEFLGADRALKVLGLIAVEDAMHKAPEETIESGQSAGRALDWLKDREYAGALVEKDGEPVGCIERSQLDGVEGTVDGIFSGTDRSVRRGDDLQKALSLLLMSDLKSVCVVDDDRRPVGFVSMEGIRRTIAGLYAREGREAG